ncbi:SsgA family sporulation/cell division regulator [Streptomyces sp. NPDC048212]|uniref:SsgA family sporulation/cell division regulator n=1 Tax=Streptomyces sp. NPDC048212 TaxID=3156658 RepID=UPI0033EEEEF0
MNPTKTLYGEATNGIETSPVGAIWSYDPDDPWVVLIDFPEQEVTWAISLELLQEALTSPVEGLQGSGDVLIEVSGSLVLLHLSNRVSSATVRFSFSAVLEFLNQLDDQDSSDLVGRQLDEFLEAL